MFKLSFITLALFSSLTFAQSENCMGDLCKGETVIDSSNYVGIITGFKDGQILYRRNGYNSDSASYSGSLSEKVVSSKIPPGSYGIDESNYVGQIKNVFTDGRVEYRREGYSSNSISRSISPEISEKDGVKKDVYVIDESNYVGKTYRTFANGKTQYLREGYNSKSISNKVSPEIPGKDGIKRDVYVIDESNYVGKTYRTFANGKTQYLRDGFGSKSISNKVSPEIQENNGISRSKKVIDESNYVGITKRVFRNGKFQYRRNGYGSDSISSNLSPEVKVLNNIDSGKSVMDESNYSGTAITVFADGRVEYRRDGFGSNSISLRLAHEIPELENGTKTGTVVLDESNYVGTAKIVYNDGRTLYRRNGYGSNSVGSALAYEVESHNTYEKGIEYASPSHTIGHVLHFFSNNKLELSGVRKVVSEKLFESVDELDNIKAGTEVIQPEGVVVVEKIFANYTAKVIVDKEEKAIQILTLKQIEEQITRQQWLLALSSMIREDSFRVGSSPAVRKEDYRRLLELLKEDLENSRTAGLSKDTLKKVSEHIDNELKKIN